MSPIFAHEFPHPPPTGLRVAFFRIYQ
jgi:hypothetical protein